MKRVFWGWFIFGMLATLLALISAGHCATGTTRNNSDLGAVAYLENPNAYIMGSIVDGQVLTSKQGHLRYATNIRLAPSYTFMLYNETILLCGNRARDFDGKTGVLVITYQRQASTMFDSAVPCHELEAVDKVQGRTDF
jgi:hypothetical protein